LKVLYELNIKPLNSCAIVFALKNKKTPARSKGKINGFLTCA
tara:strand:- start:5011 stop:5136 length:126 start_codon:yes stop_codon:yes gene_type:complete